MQIIEKQIAVVAFGKAGATKALQLIQAGKNQQNMQIAERDLLKETGFVQTLEKATLFFPKRMKDDFSTEESSDTICFFEGLHTLMEELMVSYRCIICFGAVGIAVRGIAPYLTSKLEDPAVLVCDDNGHYVISVLSGHAGQANTYAIRVAELLEAQPVITTASDVMGVFAVDNWAVEQGMHMEEPHLIKNITAALLEGKKIGFASDLSVKGILPTGFVQDEPAELGILISMDLHKQPYSKTLHLLPKKLVVGVGCKKGTTGEALEEAWQNLCKEYHLHAEGIAEIASIDLKAKEEGLLQWAGKRKTALWLFSSEELRSETGVFPGSAFVEQITGVDNVCQRAAARCCRMLNASNGHDNAAKCLVAKQKLEGITFSIYEKADMDIFWNR